MSGRWLVIAAAMAATMHASASQEVEATFSNPIYESADPYVLLHDGVYYFTRADGHNRIFVSRSATLTDKGEESLVYTFPPGQWNSLQVWGPIALFSWEGRWYLYYSASDGDNANHRVGVLMAQTDDPRGPYDDLGMVETGGSWAIAAHPFQGLDGDWYVVWSGWDLPTDGFPQHTYVAAMHDPWTLGPRVRISSPEHAWEGAPHHPLQEGHVVIRRGDRLFMVYSANASWGDDYALGMLVLEGGDPLDPAAWVKRPDPVFARTDDVLGPGGASFTTSPDGREDWLVYHSAQFAGSGWQRYVNARPFGWTDDGEPDLGAPLAFGAPLPLPSGDHGRPSSELFEETWNAGTLEWTRFGGTWQIGTAGIFATDHQYHVGRTDAAKSLALSTWFSDVSVDAELAVVNDWSASDAGIVVRATAASIGRFAFDGYYVGIDAHRGVVLLARVDGETATVLAEHPAPVRADTVHRLHVDAEGTRFRVYLDGETSPSIDVEDHAYGVGAVGVRADGTGAYWNHLVARSRR